MTNNELHKEMNMTLNNQTLLALATLATLGLAATPAHAQATTDTVKYSSYVQNRLNGAGSGYVATTRSGSAGAYIYYTNDSNVDIQGPGTAASASQFASYALLDFATPYTFTAPVSTISGLALNITEYGFSATSASTNSVDIYLVTDSTTSDFYSTTTTNSPLDYDATATGATSPAGLGTQLGTTYLLGTASYSNGKPQSVSLPLTPNSAASALFISQLNSGGNIRLVLAQDASAPTPAEAYDGSFYANKATGATPLNLTFNAFDANGNALVGTPVAAPEPSGVVALALGAGVLGLMVARRRKSIV